MKIMQYFFVSRKTKKLICFVIALIATYILITSLISCNILHINIGFVPANNNFDTDVEWSSNSMEFGLWSYREDGDSTLKDTFALQPKFMKKHQQPSLCNSFSDNMEELFFKNDRKWKLMRLGAEIAKVSALFSLVIAIVAFLCPLQISFDFTLLIATMTTVIFGCFLFAMQGAFICTNRVWVPELGRGKSMRFMDHKLYTCLVFQDINLRIDFHIIDNTPAKAVECIFGKGFYLTLIALSLFLCIAVSTSHEETPLQQVETTKRSYVNEINVI